MYSVCRWVLAAVLLSFVSVVVRAELVPAVGFQSMLLADPDPSGGGIGGLDARDGAVYYGWGTNVWRWSVTAPTSTVFAGIPSPTHGFSFIEYQAGKIHLAKALSGSFDTAYEYGVATGSTYAAQVGLVGIYDGALDARSNLYVTAAPTFANTGLYRFDAASTSFVLVASIGGWSGGIAVDAQDRVYVAEQNNGTVLRFTPDQLDAGGLTAADGEIVAHVYGGYLCLDRNGQLYVTTGSAIEQYDPATTNHVRTVAYDDLGAWAMGWLAWDASRDVLIATHTDYSNWPLADSTLHAIQFADAIHGIPGTSTVFKAWIAGYRDFIRPVTNSGGFANNDDATNAASIAEAITGRPRVFDNFTGNTHVLSLGTAGSIVLTLESIMTNGPGPDFAVFENGFYNEGQTYAEYAFVEVATTTNAWARFPVTSYTTNEVGFYEMSDVTRIDGVAGKSSAEFGTPFDLAWLHNDPAVRSGAVDLAYIRFIRLVDIPGDGSVTDQFGRPIYDPYQEFVSSTDGFDLRAIGVIHSAGLAAHTSEEGLPVLSLLAQPDRSYQLQYSHGDDVWHAHGEPVTGHDGALIIDLPVHLEAALFRIVQDIPVTP